MKYEKLRARAPSRKIADELGFTWRLDAEDMADFLGAVLRMPCNQSRKTPDDLPPVS